MSYDEPAATKETVGRLVGAGMNRIVLNLPRPYPRGVARWPADEIIAGRHSTDPSAARPRITA